MVNFNPIKLFSKSGGAKSVSQVQPQTITKLADSKLAQAECDEFVSKPKQDSLTKSVWKFYKRMRKNVKELGVGSFDLAKIIKHGSPVGWVSIFDEMVAKKTLGNVVLQKRNRKGVIDATLEKLNFKEGDIVYVLKKGKRQLGTISAEIQNKNEIEIDFMTNILGRQKYRNIENYMLQGMVEDCIKKGFVPKIRATAVNIGENMGRGYNNSALYERMGMKRENGEMVIEPKDVLKLIEPRIKRNGEIVKGSMDSLEKLKEIMMK